MMEPPNRAGNARTILAPELSVAVLAFLATMLGLTGCAEAPTNDWQIGPFTNVCLLGSLVLLKGRWLVYYGTADSRIAVACCPAGPPSSGPSDARRFPVPARQNLTRR